MRRTALLILVLLVSPAAADDPKFVYGSHDDVKDVKAPEWFVAAEAGAIFTAGNSETTTANGAIHASRKTGENKLSLEASGAYAKSGIRELDDMNGNGLIDGPSEIVTVESVTEEMLAAKLRYDRFLTSFNSLYVAALANRDTPAGVESALGGQVGYSRQLYKSKTAETVGEVGIDYSRETPTTSPEFTILSGRAFLGYKATMTEGTLLDTSLEVLSNFNREILVTGQDGGPFQDTRVNFKVAINSKIGTNLAVQMAFEAHYDNRPDPLPIKDLAPGYVPIADSLDTIMKLSFIYTFSGAPKPKPPAVPPPCTPAPLQPPPAPL